jgi:hypothetical protein
MNWTISQLNRTLPDGVVYTAHWRLSDTDGDASGSVYGTISFPAKALTEPGFIPYDNITEAQVIDWVKEAMGADTVAAHEANVAGQIQAQKNPTQAAGVPW